MRPEASPPSCWVSWDGDILFMSIGYRLLCFWLVLNRGLRASPILRGGFRLYRLELQELPTLLLDSLVLISVAFWAKAA
jgi:hypothetical protein